MRSRNVPQITEDDVLNDFTANIDDHSTFAPTDSDFMAIHAGSLIMKGGLFAYAANEGLIIASAFPVMDDDAKGMAGYHMLQQYPETVGTLKKSPMSRADRETESILWLAGKELFDNDRHILGGFVLMAFKKDITVASRTLLLPFASKVIGKVLRSTEQEALADDSPATEAEKKELEKITSDETYDENVEGLAMHILAGFFPKPRKFRKLLNLRRKS